MTMGVGPEVWERFGHNFIGIRDTRAGTDRVYNYGVFSFRQQNFLLHFIQGRMTYWMEGADGELMRQAYRRANRSIWIQELNLTPAQRAALRDFLEWNEREENKYYRYDYYRDNCSTRVRDALDRVLGGAIQRQTGSAPAGTTYRWQTLRLTANNLAIWTGLLVAEGQPVDHPLSVWEEMFLPLALRERIRTVTVPGPGGTDVPLVASEQTVFDSGVPVPARPPRWLPGFLAAGLLLGGALVALARASRPVGQRLFVVLGTLWGLAAGLAGVVISGLWLLTDHAITARNENLLQISPLLLVLGAVLPFVRRPSDRLRRLATTDRRIVAPGPPAEGIPPVSPVQPHGDRPRAAGQPGPGLGHPTAHVRPGTCSLSQSVSSKTLAAMNSWKRSESSMPPFTSDCMMSSARSVGTARL